MLSCCYIHFNVHSLCGNYSFRFAYLMLCYLWKREITFLHYDSQSQIRKKINVQLNIPKAFYLTNTIKLLFLRPIDVSAFCSQHYIAHFIDSYNIIESLKDFLCCIVWGFYCMIMFDFTDLCYIDIYLFWKEN